LKRLFLIILIAFFSTICFAEQDSNTILIVEVQNGTKNGADISEDEVTVSIYHHGQLRHRLDGNVGPDGKTSFSDVPTEEHFVAIASVKHQDMMFNSKQIKLQPGQANTRVIVDVFDVSSDRSKLSVLTHHFIIKVQDRALNITEYVQLENASDMAITSSDDLNDQRFPLEMMLPKGFKDLKCLSYFSQNDILETKDGFSDTMAVPPGQYHPAFSYSLDIDSASIDIVKKLSLPTSNFIVFAEIGQAQLKGLGAPTNKATGPSGAPMNYYKINNISPDGQIEFQITGFNVSQFDRSEWIVSGLVFAGVIILVLLKMQQTKKTSN
jgi:hypothetical protein